jgi:hypothetical protein
MATDATATPNPEEVQWEIIHEETPDRILFEEEGDWIVGSFVGGSWITPPAMLNAKTGEMEEQEPFLQLTFRNVLTSAGDSLRLAVTNAGYALRTAYESGVMEEGILHRLTLVKLTKIEGQQSPMKDLRVEKAKASASNHK